MASINEIRDAIKLIEKYTKNNYFTLRFKLSYRT